ncbi:hypothetical protein GGX14DRAFT_346285 [Mycena pura]|uniref:Uncharacterized protein n=1 Tax=Mycena pura TaxID=153505 RepID=A0AAD7E4G8_9AGAR|nr:hypothetical protein GGX14DRAFT_346285 [Mycena pura]
MSFVFAFLPKSKSYSARKIHIRRVYDVMQMCIQRNDFERATRAWNILARCKEVNWRTLWTTGVHILAENLDASEDASEKDAKKIDFLRVMMLQYPDDRETILKELVLRLILVDQCREALDELELYLPSFPYQDNPLLHIYAGLLSLYLAQPALETASQSNPTLLRDAQSHFERARALGPNSTIADAFLWRVRKCH